jgi:hypothetical protein
LAFWFLRIEANPLSNWLTLAKTRNVEKRSWFKQHLIADMASTGLFLMAAILREVIRFSPKSLISER